MHTATTQTCRQLALVGLLILVGSARAVPTTHPRLLRTRQRLQELSRTRSAAYGRRFAFEFFPLLSAGKKTEIVRGYVKLQTVTWHYGREAQSEHRKVCT